MLVIKIPNSHLYIIISNDSIFFSDIREYEKIREEIKQLLEGEEEVIYCG